MKITIKKIKQLLKDFFARNVMPSSESEELSDLATCLYFFFFVPFLTIATTMNAFGSIDEHYASIVKDREHCSYTDPVCNAWINEQAAFVGLIFGYSTFCLGNLIKWLNYLKWVSDKTEKNTDLFIEELKDVASNALFFKKTINTIYSDLASANAEGKVIVSDNYYWQVIAASVILGVIANDRFRALLGGKIYTACNYFEFSRYKHFDATANVTRGCVDFVFVGFKAFNVMRPLILNLQLAFDTKNVSTVASKKIRYAGGVIYALPFAIYSAIYPYDSEQEQARFEKLIYITLGMVGVAFFSLDLVINLSNFDTLLLIGLMLFTLIANYIVSRALCNHSANCFSVLNDDEKLLDSSESLTDPERALKASAEADAKLDASIYEMTSTRFGFWKAASSSVKWPKHALSIPDDRYLQDASKSYIEKKR